MEVGTNLLLGLQILWMLSEAMIQPAIAHPGNTPTLIEVSIPLMRSMIELKGGVIGKRHYLLQASLEYRVVAVPLLYDCANRFA